MPKNLCHVASSLWAVVCLLNGGCPITLPSAGQLEFSCSKNAQCLEGYTCVDNICRPQSGDSLRWDRARWDDAGQGDSSAHDRRIQDVSRDAADTGPFPDRVGPELIQTDVPADVPTVGDTQLFDRGQSDVTDGARPDLVAPDMTVLDTPAPDAYPTDVPAADASAPDLNSPDISSPDTYAPDAHTPDLYVPDTSVRDTSIPDTSIPDTSIPDTSVPDNYVLDTSIPDTSVPDTYVPDSAQHVVCQLQAGVFTFSAPELVANINSSGVDRDPVLSADGLTLYFASDRSGGLGGWDIWKATRPDRESPFSTPVAANELSSPQDDTRVTFTADERYVIVASNRPNWHSMSFWYASRASTAVAWSSFSFLAVISTPNRGEYDPTLNSNGLHIYYAPDDRPGSTGGQDIFFASRAAIGDAFSPPENLTTVNTVAGENDPSFTYDELTLLLGSDRAGDTDIYYAVRASVGEAFGTPEVLPVVNSNANDGDPFLSGDGCELFFYSERSGGPGGQDIWVARYQQE